MSWSTIPPLDPWYSAHDGRPAHMPVERMRQACLRHYAPRAADYPITIAEIARADDLRVWIWYRGMRFARLIPPIAEELGAVVEGELVPPALPAPEGGEG